jgi:Na+/H+-dicarboxylate symporter
VIKVKGLEVVPGNGLLSICISVGVGNVENKSSLAFGFKTYVTFVVLSVIGTSLGFCMLNAKAVRGSGASRPWSYDTRKSRIELLFRLLPYPYL